METVPQGFPAPGGARAAGVSLPPPPPLGPPRASSRFSRDCGFSATLRGARCRSQAPGRALGTWRRGAGGSGGLRRLSGWRERGGSCLCDPPACQGPHGSAGRGLTNGPSADGRPRAALRGARVALPARGPRRAHGPPLPGEGRARGHRRRRSRAEPATPPPEGSPGAGPGRPKRTRALGAPC